MQYTFISDSEALKAFCEQASKTDSIAVDTEFVRTRTLYPQLGLIQLYDGKQLVLVDPLQIEDFSSLVELLTNPNVVKVLHACSEDLETFWHAFKVTPAPIFDSQFAASIVGMGTSLGYAKLVESMLGVTVDKGESRTDWLARPLSEKQCHYAANDVLYLYQLYAELKASVDAKGRMPWVYSEAQMLAQKKQLQIPADLVYLSVKNGWKLSGKALAVLQRLCAWRIEVAQKRDMALNFVVREENLVEIAKSCPSSKNALRAIPGMNPHEIRVHGEALLNIVAECEALRPEDYPPRVERLNNYAEYKNTIVSIRKVCATAAEEQSIPIEIIGSKKQINQLLKWCWFKRDDTKTMSLLPDLLTGWRRALFAEKLSKIDSLNLNKCFEQECL